MAGQSDVIQVAAVGRPFGLGMLYDCRTDKLVPGITLWDHETLKKNLDSRSQQYSDYEIITSDSIDDKAKSLDINGGLKLGFLAGLVEVSGSAKYLKDRTSSSHQERVTLNYKCTTKYESLTMSQLGKGKFDHPDIFDSVNATHVVTGIEYGGDAFLVFDKQHSESESKENIRGSVHAQVKLISKIEIDAGGKLKSSEHRREQTDSLNVSFHGDCKLSSNPTTYDEAVAFYKTIPELFGRNGENAVPKKVWLYPLCNLDSRASKLVREISANLVNSATRVIEQLHEHEIKCNDLLKTPACYKFQGLRREVEIFKEMIDVYKIDFQKQLLHVLPGIRGGGAEESELADILKKRECSPLNEQGMRQWLQQKDSEASVLNRYIQSMGDIPFVGMADLEAECMDPDSRHVVCFTVFRLSKDSYLSAMKEYLENPDIKTEQLLPLNKSQFQGKGGKSMIHNARIFKKFESEDKDILPVTTKFMIVEEETDSEPGGKIYLYRDGELLDENFIPPSEPRNLTVTDIKHDSVTLTWQKPEHGVHCVTEYEIKYNKTGETEMISERVEKCEPVVIRNLQADTSYDFQVRARSKASISNSCEKKISTSIDLYSPKNKLSGGKPSIYLIPKKAKYKDEEQNIRKFEFGVPSTNRVNEKVIILVGEVGCGKTTLIDAMINYLLGVKWKDDVRFKLIEETPRGQEANQAKSQTSWITAYTIHHKEGCRIPYTLTIIDTPGFGVSLHRNKEITKQIETLFTTPGGGIDHIDAVGFVVQSSLTRMNHTHRSIFLSILALFGRDIKDNIFMLLTFADSHIPQVLDDLKEAGFPYENYFKFNNSALFVQNVNGSYDTFGIDEMFWQMGTDSFKSFFASEFLASVTSKSMTK